MLTDSIDEYLALAACLVVPGLVMLVVLMVVRSRRRRWDYNRRYPKD